MSQLLSLHAYFSAPGRNAELVEAGDGAPLGGRVVLVVPPLPAAQAEAVALHGVPPFGTEGEGVTNVNTSWRRPGCVSLPF